MVPRSYYSLSTRVSITVNSEPMKDPKKCDLPIDLMFEKVLYGRHLLEGILPSPTINLKICPEDPTKLDLASNLLTPCSY